jgi:isoamyl acetate esterase
MMKRVVLIGDSIRMGYQDTVRQMLEATLGEQNVSVWVPDENGGDSRNVLAHLDDWIFAQQPTVLHINCGLHDIKRPFDAGALTIPLDQYEANVREILDQVVHGPMACQVIWATTTPVNEAWHHARKPFDRFEDDVRDYNAVAVGVAQDLGVPVNDLFALVMGSGRDKYLVPDGVHLTGTGYRLLGQAVADVIGWYL